MKVEGVSAGLAIERPAAGIAVLRLSGWDVGEFGDAPMRDLARDLDPARPLELYIDARAVRGATVDVSNDWALWLRAHRAAFAHVSMLTGSPYVQLTAKFVQRFAGLESVMRIYTDPAAFDGALHRSVAANR